MIVDTIPHRLFLFLSLLFYFYYRKRMVIWHLQIGKESWLLRLPNGSDRTEMAPVPFRDERPIFVRTNQRLAPGF